MSHNDSEGVEVEKRAFDGIKKINGKILFLVSQVFITKMTMKKKREERRKIIIKRSNAEGLANEPHRLIQVMLKGHTGCLCEVPMHGSSHRQRS